MPEYDEAGAERYDRRHPPGETGADLAAALLADLADKVTAADPAAGPVLELGIGTGRLALALAALGVEVHGIDSSPAMVERLQAKPGGADLRVVLGDFARAGDLVAGPYSLVFVAASTLFELRCQADQAACLAGAARLLSPAGLLVVEAVAPEPTSAGTSVVLLDSRPDEVALQVSGHDPVAQRAASADLRFGASGARVTRSWTIRYATVAEVDLMARLAGLSLRHRWAGWRREPFDSSSPVHVSVYGRGGP